MFIKQFKAASAEGAVVELKMRLLCDKIPALQKYAQAKKLEDVESAIAAHFCAALPKSDKEKLTACRRIRNKILHSDFRAARDKLEASGASIQKGDVKKVDISGLSLSEVAEKLTSGGTDVAGTFGCVADTKTTAAGGVFGWLLEMGTAGDFQQAVDTFNGAAVIIDRLATMNRGELER